MEAEQTYKLLIQDILDNAETLFEVGENGEDQITVTNTNEARIYILEIEDNSWTQTSPGDYDTPVYTKFILDVDIISMSVIPCLTLDDTEEGVELTDQQKKELPLYFSDMIEDRYWDSHG